AATGGSADTSTGSTHGTSTRSPRAFWWSCWRDPKTTPIVVRFWTGMGSTRVPLPTPPSWSGRRSIEASSLGGPPPMPPAWSGKETRAMLDEHDVRRIAMALPDVTENDGDCYFRVNGDVFAWPWRERVHPGKPK